MTNYNKKVLFVVLFIATQQGLAVSSQADGQAHFPAERIMQFAKKVQKPAAQYGSRLVIVGRIGRDKKKLPMGSGYHSLRSV